MGDKATRRSFASILDEDTDIKRIEIPMIQRDYAQGRDNEEIKRKREVFLGRLRDAVDAVNGKPITLDFVYGNIKNGVMEPLDGQQRLTTLFLLHWYAAKKKEKEENIRLSKFTYMSKFTYKTRYSAESFCRELVDRNSFTPSCDGRGNVSKEIKNEAWFPLDWENDPTVSSMLVMLDAIDERFHDVDKLWERLTTGNAEDCPINFDFLSIEDMELTDDIYIKMNSRGRQLTEFEQFKARLEQELSKNPLIGEGEAKKIIRKFDTDWTDMLWPYAMPSERERPDLDSKFMNYLRFICDIISYKAPQEKSDDILDYFKAGKEGTEEKSQKDETSKENIETVSEYFECWLGEDKEKRNDFWKGLISQKHEEGHIKYGTVNLFEKCLNEYDINTVDRILLYTIVRYRVSEMNIKNFSQKLRIIHNLARNSGNEMRDMMRTLGQVETVLCGEEINTVKAEGEGRGFNLYQIGEEKFKLEWAKTHSSDEAEKLFELEDHELLEGQIGVLLKKGDNSSITLDTKYFKRFKLLFECDREIVGLALLALGDCFKVEWKNSLDWPCRRQLGTKELSSWRKIFLNTNNNFDEAGNVLKKLLDSLDDSEISADGLQKIIREYCKYCEENELFDWKYYLIKEENKKLRSQGGTYAWSGEGRPYEMVAMGTSVRARTRYQPFLKALAKDEQFLGEELELDWGNEEKEKKKYLRCKNNGYELYEKGTDGQDKQIAFLEIKQNSDGIDQEDRIEKAKEKIKEWKETYGKVNKKNI